ncbi:MAG: hypothetical protein ACI9LY_002215 [Arenicella sp.]|jgi:hypothetical protein
MFGRFNNHLPRMLGCAEILSKLSGISQLGVNQTQMAQSSRVFESFNVTPTSTIAAFANFDNNLVSSTEVHWLFKLA